MEIRLAFPNEVAPVMTIIADAKKQMASYGSDQWQDGYPDEKSIFDDILNGNGYVALVDGEIVAYTAVILGHEDAYDAIYDGKWEHNNQLYVTFHRIAINSAFQGQQIAQTFLQGLIEGYDAHDFRCDTHEKNLAMQHILEKLGYVYCGKVPLHGVRLAYQKIKNKRESSLYQEVDEASHHAY